MKLYKEVIGDLLKGKSVKVKCECIATGYIQGIIVDYSIIRNEIIYTIDTGTKYVKVGENSPQLLMEIKGTE